MDELIELERAGWESLCDGTGDDFYGRIMTDDGVMVLADGSVMNRNDVVSALGEAPPWASFEMTDIRSLPLDDDTIALLYVGTGHRQGEALSFVGVMTSIYARREGRWRLVLYQQTPLRVAD